MSAEPPISVLIIEDDMDIAETISDFLSLEGMSCDHAYDGEQGLALARSEAFDVILLDVMLPFRDGIGVCRALRDDGVDTPVLMLTARDTLDDKLDGFRAGADDYVVKPFELEEVVMRVSVLSRRRSGEAARFELAGLEVDFQRKDVRRDGQLIPLSPTGWRLLTVLVRASPDIVPKKRLEEALWGDEPPDGDAMKTNLYKLRQKLDKPFDRPLIHTVAGQGVALRAE